MGTDLYHLQREIVTTSHPRLVNLLSRIKCYLESDPIGGHEDLIAEIERELQNARIR